MLALVGAFLAPFLTGGVVAWSPPVLEAYLALLGVTARGGQRPAPLVPRRRRDAGPAADLDPGGLAAVPADEDAAILLALALAGPALAVLWRRRGGVDDLAPKTAGIDLFLRLPLGALILVSLVALGLWRTWPAIPAC